MYGPGTHRETGSASIAAWDRECGLKTGNAAAEANGASCARRVGRRSTRTAIAGSFAGGFSDGYLQRDAPTPGYAIVVWRGPHVADVSEMADPDLVAYWAEVVQVARALTRVFEPCHLNYNLLGNGVPHVQTHVVPRYVDDPCPNAPLTWVLEPVPDETLDHQVQRLRTCLP